jgi:CheY-like chemotaxis protein
VILQHIFLMSAAVILLVDDSDDDAFFFRKAIQKARLNCVVQHLTDGRAAMDYLSGIGPYADRQRYPLPALVLLDSHLPRVTGLEVLVWARAQDQFQNLPMALLTGSAFHDDESHAIALGATAYFQKIPGLAEVMEFIRTVVFGENKSGSEQHTR